MNRISNHLALSDAEIASRAVVAANAIGSTELEGLSVSDHLRKDLDAWCHGEVDIGEVIEKAKARHSRA